MALIITLAIHGFYDYLQSYFSLTWLQKNFETIKLTSTEHYCVSVMIFLALRFFFSVVSIPGTGVLTVAGGALFGLWLGSLLTAVAVCSGLVVTFLLSRYAFRDMVRRKAGAYLAFIDKGTAKYGSSFLFLLRVMEVAPSFLINTAFGLTTMKVWTYFWISLAGILPGIIIFANAGTRLAELESLSGLVNPAVVASLAALGLLIICSRSALSHLNKLIGGHMKGD